MILTCQTCDKKREVSRCMVYHIRRGTSSGKCLSCSMKGRSGPYKGERYDKDLYQSRIYSSWTNMKTRCSNEKVRSFSAYGGRGITYCERWKSFKSFLDDMQESYLPDLTLERIDNNSGYSKENCRWATPKEQAQNTRNVERAARYEFNGEKLTVRQWSERCGVKRTTLDRRLRVHKWPIENALKVEV